MKKKFSKIKDNVNLKNNMIIILSLFFFILGIFAFAYGYFTGGNTGGKDIIIKSRGMKIKFEDTSVIALNNAGPGDSASKSFQVDNSSDYPYYYTINWETVFNNFTDTSDLLCTLVSAEAGINFSGNCPTIAGEIEAGIQILSKTTHNYTLTVTFVNRYETDQSSNAGKSFNAKIGVEVTDPEDIIISETFAYTGSVQLYKILVTGIYKLEAYGAQGGGGYTYSGGGKGGYTSGELELQRGDDIYIYVGGAGSTSTSGSATREGAGFNSNANNITDGATAGNRAGGGGGATDIRINNAGLAYRVIVAGGGGGQCGHASSDTYCAGGVGGTTTGGSGMYQATNATNVSYAGQGGTQTAGGAAGTYTSYGPGQAGSWGSGGYGGVRGASTYYGAGAGGGGFFGGGGGAYCYGGGGGGSSFAYTESNAFISLLSDYYIDSTTLVMTAGVQTGNGSATLTYMGVE